MNPTLQRLAEVDASVPTLPELISQSPEGIGSLGPISVLVYRVGPLEDRGRGIFFGGTAEDAQWYADFHSGHQVTPCIVRAKNALIAPNLHALWMHFFGKQLYIHEINIKKKFQSNAKALFYADSQIAKKARGSKHDVIVYTKPKPPAKTELAVVKATAKIEPGRTFDSGAGKELADRLVDEAGRKFVPSGVDEIKAEEIRVQPARIKKILRDLLISVKP